MQAKSVRTNSIVADLITSAGLLGNSLAKEQDSLVGTFTAVRQPARSRQQVSSRSSAEAPALAALLGRSASGKQQPCQPGWPSSMGSASKLFQESQPPAKHNLAATQPTNTQPDAAGCAANTNSGGGVCINAAKPDLLALLQAVGQCAPLAVTAADHPVAQHNEQAGNQLSVPHEQPQALNSGTSVSNPKTQVDRPPSDDSIFGGADGVPAVEPASVVNPAQPQRLGSASARQQNKLSDEALQAAIREAEALATNADISRRKAERRAQKLDKDLAGLQTLVKQRESQTQELQQQLAAATEASERQKQSHQHTLMLLDQAHMERLSQLQAQLLNQSRDYSAKQTQLKLELAEQSELTQQAELRLSEHENECMVLRKKSAEDHAVAKMLLRPQTETEAERPSDESSTPATPDVRSSNSQLEDSLVANPTPMSSAGTMAERTLILEADVLRREARILKEQLAKAEAALQKLAQDRREDELQSSAKVSRLEGVLSGLEAKHSGAAALLSQTLTAIQSKTSTLLQQRASAGEGVSTADAAAGSTQLSVLSQMNEQLASENAALITELATVERQRTRQVIQEGRQKEVPAFVAGIPAKMLESFLSPPRTAAAVAADQPSQAASTVGQMSAESMGGCDEEAEQGCSRDNIPKDSAKPSSIGWIDTHSELHQRTQQLDTQIELTQLRSEVEILKAEAAEATADAVTKEGLVHTLQRQLRDADSQHQQEIKELKRAAKQVERRAEQLAQQLPKKADDSSVQALREELAKQRHVWASTKKTLQAQQSSLQDECNDLACQLAERDQQLRGRDERIMQLKKQLQEADLTVVTSRRGSEAVALDIQLGSGTLNSSDIGNSADAAPPERAPSVSGPNLDMPARLTLQRYRNEASAAKYEMNAVLKEMKRHKKESDRVQLQQQLSIRSLKDQLALAQQTLQELGDAHEADTAKFEQQLSNASAEKSSLQAQLQDADMHIHSTDAQLQASRLNMRYLKVRQQQSQTTPALSYVQAYEVSCGSDLE